MIEEIVLAPLHFHASSAAPDDWQIIEPGFTYRDAAAASFLTTHVTVPDSWSGKPVGMHIVIPGGEPLLYLNGKPYQALDYNHHDVLLTESAKGGEVYELRVEIYAPTRGVEITVQKVALVQFDPATLAQQYDIAVAQQIAELGDDKVADKGVAVSCIGHSHLDLAYLWALPNTRKKVGRTWSSALRLMEEYPDFRFAQTQAYLYDVCKTDYPDLYEQVRARVAEGRWELLGGMWVEPDANIPSGESLIRQVLYGQTFFQREFGQPSRVAWLPDTFGFPASFPQILAGCGIDYLLTSKISWNDTNRFPYDTFRWRGIDGVSEVLTYFITTPQFHDGLKKWIATYNGEASARHLAGAWNRYQQKTINQNVLHCVGYGDGGGGATRAMVEMIQRFDSAEGVPAARFDRADGFFDRLPGKSFPTWRGELYLENHRGTLTSQAFIKRANRRGEILLRNAEIFSVLATAETGAAYPTEELDAAWKILLTNQFHDILAGTILPQAVVEAREDYEALEQVGEGLLNTALSTIAARIPVKEDTVVVFNPTDTLRPSDVLRVTIPASVVKSVEFADASGALLPSQFLRVNKKGDRHFLVLLGEVGALGYETISVHKSSGPQEESTVFAEIDGDEAILENDFVRVTLNSHGEVLSLIHKISADEDDDPDAIIEREVIAEGERGNVLAIYEDKPAAYDAWNIDPDAFTKRTDLSQTASVTRFAVVAEGPVRSGIEIVRTFGDSTIHQWIYLYAHSPRLEVQTEADWHEKQTLLCVHFPVTVNSDRATYEIQHGYIERPTHTNTSWDAARFEVAHHRWMDLSEGDYGVSLINDCKYSGCVRDNDLRLTLIKSGIYPDPEADHGAHRFTYALLPHTGDFRSETLDEAHAMNYLLQSRFVGKAEKRQAPALPKTYALASVNDQGLVIDAIKQAEDGNGYIIRLYEAFNTRGTATLTLGFDVREAFITNLLEENQEPIAVTNGGDIAFAYRPHEIKTFRVCP